MHETIALKQSTCVYFYCTIECTYAYVIPHYELHTDVYSSIHQCGHVVVVVHVAISFSMLLGNISDHLPCIVKLG